MKKYILIFFLLGLILTSFLRYKFSLHKKLINQISIENEEFKRSLFYYSNKYLPKFPTKKEDIELAMKYSHQISEHSFSKIDEYGYNVYYDSIEKSLIVYSFGFDKIDNKLNKVPYNFIDSTNFYQLKNISFFDFLKSKNSDIILFNIKKSEPEIALCERYKNPNDFIVGDENRYDLIQLIKKDDFINKIDKKQFIKEIVFFEKKLNNEISLGNNCNIEDLKTIFFRFEKNKISVICKNGLSEKYLNELILELEMYIRKNDTSYFDYAVFPLNIIDPRSR